MFGWGDLVAAIGLLFVIEGLVCLAAPSFLRKAMTAMLELNNVAIQKFGIIAALFGVALLWLNA